MNISSLQLIDFLFIDKNELKSFSIASNNSNYKE